MPGKGTLYFMPKLRQAQQDATKTAKPEMEVKTGRTVKEDLRTPQDSLNAKAGKPVPLVGEKELVGKRRKDR